MRHDADTLAEKIGVCSSIPLFGAVATGLCLGFCHGRGEYIEYSAAYLATFPVAAAILFRPFPGVPRKPNGHEPVLIANLLHVGNIVGNAIVGPIGYGVGYAVGQL